MVTVSHWLGSVVQWLQGDSEWSIKVEWEGGALTGLVLRCLVLGLGELPSLLHW